jgi:hypothetical protein
MNFDIFNKSDNKLPKRFPEGEMGDVYVEYGVCTSCGAPQAEAPDLIDHSANEWSHCYFKKQPKTEEEIERAINAIQVSCISGLRYGGKDEKILKRLYEAGEAEQCDNKPTGNYKMIVWKKVLFSFNGTINELADNITSQIILGDTYTNKVIVNFKSNNADNFCFVYRWSAGFIGVTFDCKTEKDNIYSIRLDKEKEGYQTSVRVNAMTLNLILQRDTRVTNLIWFDQDDNKYDPTQLK